MVRTVFLIVLISLNILANGQDKVIQGVVTTFDSIPLIDATVELRSSKKVVQTDSLGRFTIMGENKEKLKVGAKGFYSQSVKISGKEKFVMVDLKIKPGTDNVETVIGYGHVKDRNKLAAAVSIHQNGMDFSSFDNMYDLIRGKISGVQIKNGEIWIRGMNTSSSAGNAALLVVDGIVVNESTFSNMSPNNVKSVSVIKDGTAAIYGSRAANGVIVIETKK